MRILSHRGSHRHNGDVVHVQAGKLGNTFRRHWEIKIGAGTLDPEMSIFFGIASFSGYAQKCRHKFLVLQKEMHM